jgi:nucleoside phosphorylase
LEIDDVQDLLEIASTAAVGLLGRADVITCPNARCGAKEMVAPLVQQERSEGEAYCSVCEEVIPNPANRQSERRYQLTPAGDQEVYAQQAAEAAKPDLVAAVLTALPEELGAVRSQLSSEGADVTEVAVRGGGLYYRAPVAGDHANWTVYASYTEATTTSAAAGAADVILNFHPTITVYVGIAGGIEEKGVKLGDVVVATEVFDYDGGKESAEGYVPRPKQFHSAHGLKQLAAFTMLDNTWQERLLNENPGLELDAPAVHVEPIAAGSKVVASTNSETYKLVRRTADRAVAVEMEGSGFLGAVQRYGEAAIVVRGISDLIDGKDAADQAGVRQQAAANAAGFAYALLRRYIPEPGRGS